MQAILDATDGYGGIYLAVFLVAVLSGVFPLTNSEAAMIAIGAGSNYPVPKLLVLAAIVAVGQSFTHTALFFLARGMSKAGAKKRPWLEKKIVRAQALAEKWKKSEFLLMVSGATVGVPPQALVALVAGIIEVRFRTFLTIDLVGRFVRFATIVLVSRAAA